MAMNRPAMESRLRLMALTLSLASATALFTLPARAVLLAYEPFDYPEGELLMGKNSGLGFADSWTPGSGRSSDAFAMQAGKLTFRNLAVRGTNHLSADGVLTGTAGSAALRRMLVQPLGSANTKAYLSFLFRPDVDPPDVTGIRSAGVVIGGGRASAELSVGRSGTENDYLMQQPGGGGRVGVGLEPRVGETVFIVVKMEFRQGPDRFTMFLNPTPGEKEPVIGAVKYDLDVELADTVRLFSFGACSLDEIRLGTTWADVTPTQ